MLSGYSGIHQSITTTPNDSFSLYLQLSTELNSIKSQQGKTTPTQKLTRTVIGRILGEHASTSSEEHQIATLSHPQQIQPLLGRRRTRRVFSKLKRGNTLDQRCGGRLVRQHVTRMIRLTSRGRLIVGGYEFVRRMMRGMLSFHRVAMGMLYSEPLVGGS